MSPREWFDSVDDAVYATAHFTEQRPLKVIAASMGKSEDQLRDASDPHRKPRFAAVDIVPLVKASGNFSIVRTICRLVGGAFVLLPQSNAHESDLLAALGAVLREVGEDAELISKALADNGKLDAHEVPAVLENIDESMARLAQLRAVVASRMKKDGRR